MNWIDMLEKTPTNVGKIIICSLDGAIFLADVYARSRYENLTIIDELGNIVNNSSIAYWLPIPPLPDSVVEGVLK